MLTLVLAAMLTGPPAPTSIARPGYHQDAAPATRRLSPGWYALAIGGQVADAWSTRRGLAVGAREGNGWMEPAAGRPAALYSIKVGLGLASAIAGDAFYRAGQRNHSRTARIAGRLIPAIVGGAGLAYAGINEQRIARHCRQAR